MQLASKIYAACPCTIKTKIVPITIRNKNTAAVVSIAYYETKYVITKAEQMIEKKHHKTNIDAWNMILDIAKIYKNR